MTTGILLLAGLVSGFCSSAPLGPINLWLVEAVIGNSKKAIIWFLSGVLIVDITFVSLAVWGYYEYINGSHFVSRAQFAAGIFLIVIGIMSFLNLYRTKGAGTIHAIATKTSSPVKNFIMGGALCGSNPGFLMFWLFVVNFLNQSFTLEMSMVPHLLFLIGVVAGDSLWFGLLIKLVAKGLTLAKPHILLNIRYAISWSYLGFGGFAIWHSFS